jgi:long-chain fatty acid transport protein
MKRGAQGWLLVWLLAGTLAGGLALGDGFRNPPESASALGRIGGRYVFAEDASAATLNPANLAEMDDITIMGSATFGYAKRTYDSQPGLYGPDSVHEESEDPWACLPSVFAVWPIENSRWVAGLGITVPFGRFTNWDRDVIFGSFSPYYAEQWVINVNPSLATHLSDNVLVGVGVSLYQSDLLFKQLVPWSQLTGDASTPDGSARFEGDGVAFGANAAVTWKINDRHALALTYRSPFDVEYSGEFDVTDVPAVATAMGVTASSDFETEISYPTCVALGYGIRLTDTVRVEFDVEWIEHSRNQELVLDLDNNNVLLSSTSIAQDWNDNWTYGVGVDWQFTERWVARAGYIYLETPTTTTTTLPVASEEDQSVVSLGLGYQNGGHSFDVAYAIGVFDGLTVSDNVVPAVNGEYDFESHLLSLAYSYTF